MADGAFRTLAAIGAGKLGGALPLGQPEEGPRALAEALDQPGFGEKPQMARNPRLRLAQDRGEVGDRQVGFAQERENAQPRGLGGGFKRRIERLERQVGRCGHNARAGSQFARWDDAGVMTYKDIFITL